LSRAPSGDFHQFLRGLGAALNCLYNPKTEFYIYADINKDCLNKSNRKRTLVTNNLTQTANFAIEIQNDLSTAVGNIFVDNTRYSSSFFLIINGLSDHGAQYLMFNNISAVGNLIRLMQGTRKVNNETVVQLQLLLKSETWDSVYNDNDTNNKLNSFLYTFLNIFGAGF
jgi:hypothetical protein